MGNSAVVRYAGFLPYPSVSVVPGNDSCVVAELPYESRVSQGAMQHLHSGSYRKSVKMGQVLSWMLTIMLLYVLQLPLSVGGLGAVSIGRSVLIQLCVVSLCNVVICCLSMRCGLEEAVSSAGSKFTAGVRLIRGSRVPGM